MQVRVMQIIISAMLVGIVVFLGIVLVLHQQGLFGVPPAPISVVSLVAAGQFVICFAVWLILPPGLIQSGLVRIARSAADPVSDLRQLLILRQTTLIVGGALMEGAAFTALIGYLLEKQPYALGIALACVLLIVVTFPTFDRITQWLAVQMDRLEQLRQGY
jgi:hypothetical protein